MWELVAEVREPECLRLKVHVGAGGRVNGAGVLEARSLCRSWLSDGDVEFEA